jgi:hypothetical protein
MRRISRISMLVLLVFGASLHPAPAAAGDCAPVPPGLVGWWKLENNALDETGAHNGSVAGSGAFVPGEVGTGYRSNAPGNEIVVPHDAALNVTNFTIDAWVRMDSWPCFNAVIVWKGDTGGFDFSTPFGLGIYGTCERPALVGTPWGLVTNGSAQQELDAPFAIPLDTWTHLALTADGTTLTFYVDGVAVTSMAQTLTPFFNTSPLTFAALAGSNFTSGTVDEVELHSQAATATQIAAIHAAGSAGKCVQATPARPHTWGSLKTLYR